MVNTNIVHVNKWIAHHVKLCLILQLQKSFIVTIRAMYI
jgi:hypothetical protein